VHAWRLLFLVDSGLCLALAHRLLGKEHRVDIWQHAARRNRDATQQLVELLIVADRELDVPVELSKGSKTREKSSMESDEGAASESY
jgi:hypothetical protein